MNQVIQVTESHSQAQELFGDRLEATLQVMRAMERGSRIGPYGMPTLSSSGSTGSVDAGPQPMSDGEGLPITFAHGWGTKDQENVCPGSAVGGLVLIQEDGGEIDQGMGRIMEDNHVELLLWAAETLNDSVRIRNWFPRTSSLRQLQPSIYTRVCL
jgi:hypothetical protein